MYNNLEYIRNCVEKYEGGRKNMKKEAHNQTKEREGKELKKIMKNPKRNYFSCISSLSY